MATFFTPPPETRSVEETGINLAFLADLVLKVMYTRGFLMGHEIADAVRLPFANVVDRALDHLRREHLAEVRGSGGFGESSYQYVISDEGRARARETMEKSQYVGPAPVTLEAYTKMANTQSIKGFTITEEQMRRGFAHLVIGDHILAQLGPAINSGKSIFLFGEAGNGKTVIADAVGAMLPGVIFVPYAINVDGHVIKVFDELHHRVVPEKEDNDADDTPGLRKGERYDKRWVLIRRPMITVGGELMLESLDLSYDDTTKFYEAPYQLKANGGVFLIDDFGRQQMSPHALLNRWIVPLEKRVDFLTLVTGRKIDVPFDTLVIFSTNLNPEQLVDEAFLRRIRYKISIPDPTWEDYREIFKRVCTAKGVQYSEDGLRHLVMEHYIKTKRKPRAVHPRDIIDELVDIARFRNVLPAMSKELLDLSCNTYFIKS
ncbi:MAG: ATP-binding protein [Chloroflexi bacterium]|nr:ATP-binding protein [Chloroflexota bacterium]